MKKTIRMAMMAAGLFAVVTTAAEAQGGGGMRGGRGGANPVTIVKDSLKVTDATVLAKVDSIFKAYQAETQGLMQAAGGGDADARQKMITARTKMNDAIKALLTDEQKAEFDRLMPQRGRRGGGF